MAVKFVGCTAVSCVRKMTGPKQSASYRIEEECHWAKKNSCTYKRNVKVEGTKDGRADTKNKS